MRLGFVGADRLLNNFTMRSSMASRYRQGSGHADSTASAEEDKQTRYPAAGGIFVRGAAMELVVKHGPGCLQLCSVNSLTDMLYSKGTRQSQFPASIEAGSQTNTQDNSNNHHAVQHQQQHRHNT